MIPFIDLGLVVDAADRFKMVRTRSIDAGLQGETLTPVRTDGSVLIRGETWNAFSKEFIPGGEKVRVVGIRVEVERIRQLPE
ncbi:MAG: hypothetical protein JW929_13955 [Anaerolineales bacterium]|nr:hypothetical protein [Anaerolineales bacterium]